MISLSLNEIEVTLRKAAIGVGLPLGLAEDAALATTWLVARGLPGLDLCHAALRHAEDHGPTVLSMEEGQGCLIIKNPTSALWFGPAAVDHLCLQAKLNGPAEIRADWVDCPLLCFAMLAVAAAEFDLSITVAWKNANQAGAIAFCRGDEIRFSGAPPVSPGPLFISLAAPPTRKSVV